MAWTGFSWLKIGFSGWNFEHGNLRIPSEENIFFSRSVTISF